MNPRILVPVDFSEGTSKLVQAAGELAQRTGASVILLHVVEPIAAYLPVGASMDVMAPPPVTFEKENLAPSLRRLEELAESLNAKGVQVEVRAVPGLPVEEILEQASQLAPDYIVLGSHGHGALYHLFAGSVVTGVLQYANQPVVVVPVRAGE